MSAFFRKLLGATAIAVVAAGAAAEASVTITHQGFCINRDEMRCNEVALPGTMVAYDRLQQGGDKRVVNYFADMEVESEQTLVVVLESEDLDGGLEIVIDDSAKKDAKKIEPQLKKLSEKFSTMGGLTLIAFKASKSSRKPNRTFLPLKVVGPGYFAGRVVDLDGNPIPRSDRTTFSVIRRPVN